MLKMLSFMGTESLQSITTFVPSIADMLRFFELKDRDHEDSENISIDDGFLSALSLVTHLSSHLVTYPN